MGIYDKLAQIQKDLKVGKNNLNKFGGYTYRSCEDICEAVKPILARVKAALVLSDDIVQIGERIYVKATAALYDVEGSGMVSNSAFAREEESKKGMDASQVTGSASSYARKYALNGLFCLDDVKDADATNTHGKEPKPEPEKTREEMIDTINLICYKHTASDFSKQLFEHLKIDSFEGQPDAVVKRAYVLATGYDKKKSGGK